MKSNRPPFFYFDEHAQLHIPAYDLTVAVGESVAILGAKGTDVSSFYGRFNHTDPLKQLPKRRSASASPTICCVTREGTLFREFSAIDNYLLAERRILPFSKRQLCARCEELKARFGIGFDFNTPIARLHTSEAILADLLRAYLFKANVMVCDNLLSLLELKDRAVFFNIMKAMQNEGVSILYLTTKWENAVQVASRILVVLDDHVFGEVDSESARKNPEHLIYLVSGKTLIEQTPHDATASMLSMLYTGADYLTDNYKINDALSFVTQNAVGVLHCTDAQIYLPSDDNETPRLIASSSPDMPSLSESFIQTLLEHNKDGAFYVSADDISFTSIFSDAPANIKTLVCQPIKLKSRTLGFLSVFFSQYVVFDEQQTLYLSSFCKEISIIIETSRLMGSSVLLQESNHRIKNNLQIIINLISMQRIQASNDPTVELDKGLDSIIGRIQNIATVHEMLSSGKGSQTAINIRTIIQSVVRSCVTQNITFHVDSDDILVPYSKATAISMVINELVTNCAKYAFRLQKPQRENTVTVLCRRLSDSVHIEVSDNGDGFEQPVDLETSSGIGFSIIRTISRMDLRGTISVNSSEEGTRAVLEIPAFA